MERAGPMHTARFASRAAMLSRSASETAATVSMARLWQARIIRTAISPRLAIKTRLTDMRAPEPKKKGEDTFAARKSNSSPIQKKRVLRFNDEQRLTEFDELAVLRNDFHDGSAHGGPHAVKHFHDFDQTDRGIFRDLLANFDERRRAGLRCDVEGSQERRRDRHHAFRNRRGFCGCGRTRTCCRLRFRCYG